jgi:hypothetical protein
MINTEQRRVLAVLAGAEPLGCTEAILLAHGLKLQLLVDLVRDGLAGGDRLGSGMPQTADVTMPASCPACVAAPPRTPKLRSRPRDHANPPYLLNCTHRAVAPRDHGAPPR